jgi:hypothetical protein
MNNSNIQKFSALRLIYIAVACALALIAVSSLSIGHAGATQFTKTFVRLDSLKATDTGVSGRACFQPTRFLINSLESLSG